MEFARKSCIWRSVAALALLCVGTLDTCGVERKAPFSLGLGTQSIGVRYKFSSESGLVESAKEIASLGSDTLKIALTPKYPSDYLFEADSSIHSLMDLVRKKPDYAAAMDMPFRNIMLWVYPFSDSKSAFVEGKVRDSEREAIYQEIYEFTAYLLKRYAGSGKSFFIGNWEGDWHLLRENYDPHLDAAPESIQGAIDWFNLREKAVADARRDTPHTDVEVFFYIELNHVRKAMDEDRPAIVNRVLPHIRTDYVSWSSYDVTKSAARLGGEKGRALVFRALDYIEARLPKSDVAGKRVFIGEYGFDLASRTDAKRQSRYAALIIKWALEWGCPFVLYWELYCNEIDPVSGKHRGYWLIDDQGVKQPVWFLHQEILARGRSFVEDYKSKHGGFPSQTTFNLKAATWLEEFASDETPLQ